MKLIIQIPCFNESKTLPDVIADLPKSLPGIDQIEILVIDDGSDDETAATAWQLGVDHVLRHRQNRGLAAAFRSGIDASLALGADIIVNTDGDHQYPGTAVAPLVAPLRSDLADLAIGNRQPENQKHNRFTKRCLYRLGRLVIEWLTGSSVPDATSGFRAMTAATASQMHVTTRYSYTLETLVRAIESGLSIQWVPIDVNPTTRASRLYRNLPHFVFKSAMTLLRVVFMHHPGRLLFKLSMLVAAIGLVPVVRLVIAFALGDGAGHVQSLVLGAMLLVIATIMLIGGMLADLIAHNRIVMERALGPVKHAIAVESRTPIRHLAPSTISSPAFSNLKTIQPLVSSHRNSTDAHD